MGAQVSTNSSVTQVDPKAARLPEIINDQSQKGGASATIPSYGSGSNQYVLVSDQSGSITLETVHGKTATITPNVVDDKIRSISIVPPSLDIAHYQRESAPLVVHQGKGDMRVQIVSEAGDPINDILLDNSSKTFDLKKGVIFTEDTPSSRVTVNIFGSEISDEARQALKQNPIKGTGYEKDAALASIPYDEFSVSVTFITTSDKKLWSEISQELNGLALPFSVTQLPDGGLQMNPTGKIYFAHNSSELIPEAQAALKTLSAFIKEKGLSVNCLGFASKSGGDAHNQELSGNRAQIVGETFHANGVENKNIFYQAFGNEKSTSSEQLDRQVSIILGYGSKQVLQANQM